MQKTIQTIFNYGHFFSYVPLRVQPNASIEKSLELNLAYKVIPNPNNGTFELLTSSNNSITCEISDMAGRIIERGNFKPTNYKIAFNFNGQTRGVYNLKVIDNTKVTTIKIVIN